MPGYWNRARWNIHVLSMQAPQVKEFVRIRFAFFLWPLDTAVSRERSLRLETGPKGCGIPLFGR
jgi:hypothetical protein